VYTHIIRTPSQTVLNATIQGKDSVFIPVPDSEWTPAALSGAPLDYYPDQDLSVIRLPTTPENASLESYPDGWTECYISGFVKDLITNIPGFPAPLLRPKMVAYEVRQSSEFQGQGLFATRNIKAGDLILSERPLLVYPGCPVLILPKAVKTRHTHAQINMINMINEERRMADVVAHMHPDLRARFQSLCNAQSSSLPITGICLTNGFKTGIIDWEKTKEYGVEPLDFSAVGDLVSRLNHR